MIWIRICRVSIVFVVFEKFGTLSLVLKLNFQAVIKQAASTASPTAWELHGSARTTASAGGRRLRGAPMQLPSRRGGCASSRLDHSLMDPYIKSPKRQFLLHFFTMFLAFLFIYLAPSGAKYREKGLAVTKTGEGRSTNPFWNF